MKLAFDKLNQHRIIIQKRNKTRFVCTLADCTLLFHLFASLTLYGDELWIKLNKYLIALFRKSFFLYSLKYLTVECLR